MSLQQHKLLPASQDGTLLSAWKLAKMHINTAIFGAAATGASTIDILFSASQHALLETALQISVTVVGLKVTCDQYQKAKNIMTALPK